MTFNFPGGATYYLFYTHVVFMCMGIFKMIWYFCLLCKYIIAKLLHIYVYMPIPHEFTYV